MADSPLRQVLSVFEKKGGPLSLREAAHDLCLDPALLEDMIWYWVRKGRLRESGTPAEMCDTCGVSSGCPFVISLPRRFELADEPESKRPESAVCKPCH